jgi:DNA-directed RNA polymerase specialized sigma24 family protein
VKGVDRRSSFTSRAAVAAALDGDGAALRALVDEIGPAVEARVTRTIRGRRPRHGSEARSTIEDLVQDTFVVLFDDGGRLLRTWNPDRGLRLDSFVGLVAEQRVIATLRSRRRNPWTDELAFDDDDLDGSAAGEATPEAAALSREALQRLLDEVRVRVSPLGLELFMALVVREESVASVCARTNLSTAAVHAWSSRLRRMVALLGKAMADADEQGGRSEVA